MIGALSEWLRHLVMIILLAVFLDLILPTTSLQKYVRTVLGLVVMLTMLTPITALIESHFSVDALETNIAGPLFATGFPGQTSSNYQTASGNIAFQNDLSATLREEIQSGLGISLQSVEVETTVNSTGTPIVTGVNATLPLISNKTSKTTVLEEEVKEQIAESLGLPISAVHVSN
ncbi:MAG: stage III sporulation protein AF [Acidibacillus sp.]|uniref:Stage III sporulation protein AF n=1 Tax=Sulfoacidibacillus ferrooxidans TaxID=2005001 RepID=A0A9X1V8F9_9BACL|nr:hypothetical protein [Sulfoacidibacillus ferrooxidans]MCY0893141.1 stage III sporulation protein AF [Acidibacillus sp.]